MESKFKVGDRVRYTGAQSLIDDGEHLSPREVGKTGTITSFEPERNGGGAWDDGSNWLGYFSGNLEPIEAPEFKALSLLRKIVDHGGGYTNTYTEAKAIIDELEPVDPDLIEARNCVAKVYEGAGRHDLAETTRTGKQDNRLRVQSALAAIKRGRELERGE